MSTATVLDEGILTKLWLTGLLEELVNERDCESTGARMAHLRRFEELRRTGRLIMEYNLENPGTVPWVLISCAPKMSDVPELSLPEMKDELMRWFTEELRGVGEHRWSVDGLTLVDSPGHVTDAVTFGHNGRIETYTRFPLSRRQMEEPSDLVATELEDRVHSTLSIARKWHQDLNLENSVEIGVSIGSVGDSGLLSGSHNLHRTEFDRAHIHLWHRMTFPFDDSKLALRSFYDRLWQAGGKSKSHSARFER